MENNNKEISQVILKGVYNLIKNEIKKNPFDITTTGVIKKMNEDGTYDVLIGNNLYENIPSVFNGLDINNTVKIKIPQAQCSQMYIEYKYNMFDIQKIDKLESEILLLKDEINKLKGGLE